MTNIEAEPGEEYPADPHGTCVFLKEGKCSIHAVKPHECREYDCKAPDKLVAIRHRAVVNAWREPEHQQQIVDLLGREPVEADYWPF